MTIKKLPTKTKVIKKRKTTKKEIFEEGDFIPVEIWYYFKWKCPSCKKHNCQEFKPIYLTSGPEWSALGVTCNKCNKHFNITECHEDYYV